MVYFVDGVSPVMILYLFVKSAGVRFTFVTTELSEVLINLSDVTGDPPSFQEAFTATSVISLAVGTFRMEESVFTLPRKDHFEFKTVSGAMAFTCTWYNWLKRSSFIMATFV